MEDEGKQKQAGAKTAHGQKKARKAFLALSRMLPKFDS